MERTTDRRKRIFYFNRPSNNAYSLLSLVAAMLGYLNECDGERVWDVLFTPTTPTLAYIPTPLHPYPVVPLSDPL